MHTKSKVHIYWNFDKTVRTKPNTLNTEQNTNIFHVIQYSKENTKFPVYSAFRNNSRHGYKYDSSELGCNIIIARFNLHRYFCTIIYLYEDTSGLDKTASFCVFCMKGEYISTHLTLLASDDNSFITFTIKHLMKWQAYGFFV